MARITAVNAKITGDPRNMNTPYVKWQRETGSHTWHATVESAEMSWIKYGRTACNRALNPGWVLTGLVGANETLCNRCVRRLERLYPR
jgi:hypothetical protein